MSWEDSEGLLKPGAGQAHCSLLASQTGICLQGRVECTQEFRQGGVTCLERALYETGTLAKQGCPLTLNIQLLLRRLSSCACRSNFRGQAIPQALGRSLCDVQFARCGCLPGLIPAIGPKGDAHTNTYAVLRKVGAPRHVLPEPYNQFRRFAPGSVNDVQPLTGALNCQVCQTHIRMGCKIKARDLHCFSHIRAGIRSRQDKPL